MRWQGCTPRRTLAGALHRFEEPGVAIELVPIAAQETGCGEGSGPQALVVAESLCRGHDVRALHLEVEGNRPKAKVLYHRHGFETLHRQRMTKHLV